MKLVFRDAYRDGVVAEVSGEILGVPESVQVTFRNDEEWHVAPKVVGGSGEPDVLVGNLGFFTADPFGAIHVNFLELPPPEPFQTSDVSSMWKQIVDASIPNPFLQTNQGSQPLGALLMENGSPVHELLRHVQLACVNLLRGWPQLTHLAHEWRSIDDPTGVEDELETQRLADRSPDYTDVDGIRFPAVTARRVGVAHNWTSMQLALAAYQLGQDIRYSKALGEGSRWLTDLLDEVARRAVPAVRTATPPLSAWPRKARLAYSLITAARLNVRTSPSGDLAAPISDLWRMYEAWVTVATCRIVESMQELRAVGSAVPRGVGWCEEWLSERGGHVKLLAQPIVPTAGSTFEGLLDAALYSSTSDLRPDILLAVQPNGRRTRQVLTAVDAKKRQGKGMTLSDATEAGSKYMWSLRQHVDGAEVGIQEVVLATPGPTLVHPGSDRAITALHLMPSETSEFERHLLQVIDSNLTGVATLRSFQHSRGWAAHGARRLSTAARGL